MGDQHQGRELSLLSSIAGFFFHTLMRATGGCGLPVGSSSNSRSGRRQTPGQSPPVLLPPELRGEWVRAMARRRAEQVSGAFAGVLAAVQFPADSILFSNAEAASKLEGLGTQTLVSARNARGDSRRGYSGLPGRVTSPLLGQFEAARKPRG